MKKWAWLSVGVFAACYLAVSAQPLFAKPKKGEPSVRSGPIYQTTAAKLIALGGSYESLFVSEGRPELVLINYRSGARSAIPLTGVPLFALDTHSYETVVVADDLSISLVDTNKGTVLQHGMLRSARKHASPSSLRGIGLLAQSGRAWVQNGDQVEIWNLESSHPFAGTVTALPPVACFSIDENGTFGCYSKVGSTSVVRVRFSGPAMVTTFQNEIDFRVPVVAVAMDEHRSNYFALTKSGKLYFVEGNEKLLADLKGEDEGNTLTLTNTYGSMRCFDRSNMTTGPMDAGETQSFPKSDSIADTMLGPVRTYRKGRLSIVEPIASSFWHHLR